MSELTQEYLKECLNYDIETGVFTWKVRPINHFKEERYAKMINTKLSEKKAGSYKNGYIETTLNGKHYLLHRLSWLYVNGIFPKYEIDHINGILDDNRLCNLREATKKENQQNLKTAKKSNLSTGILGVTFNKRTNKFIAQIYFNYKGFFLGYFKTAEEAHHAYLTAKRELHPFGTL